jgi:predicted nucleic acid-binding Zn ribbon protein
MVYQSWLVQGTRLSKLGTVPWSSSSWGLWMQLLPCWLLSAEEGYTPVDSDSLFLRSLQTAWNWFFFPQLPQGGCRGGCKWMPPTEWVYTTAEVTSHTILHRGAGSLAIPPERDTIFCTLECKQILSGERRKRSLSWLSETGHICTNSY